MISVVLRTLCAVLFVASLAGQALGDPTAGLVRLGDFGLARGVKPNLGGGMALNSLRLGIPNQSFPELLRRELGVALREAHSDAAPAVLTAEITGGDALMSKGFGLAVLGAEFVLVRDGAEVFRKRLEVSQRWKRDFFGGAPESAVHFSELFSELARKLVNDPEFQAAVAGG